MLSPREKKLEKLDPFYRPFLSRQKTSAEIISEARNSLRTVRTQRPFTPQDDQRKLFGPASSRTPENRPSSSFSLHASSFESPDCRPISGARLSPLELKPRAPASPRPEEGLCASYPRPPLDPANIRRISSARARLFRAAYQGTLLPDRTLPPAEPKKTAEEVTTRSDALATVHAMDLAELYAAERLQGPPRQLRHSGGSGENKGQEVSKGAASLPSRLGSGGDPSTKPARTSSCPSSPGLSRLERKAASKANLQDTGPEMGADDVFWNTRILPILHELGSGDVETVCAACTRLQHALEAGNMFGRKFRRRGGLLKTLYRLVDVGSDSLSLQLAKLLLGLKVSRKNLLTVCKLIFKISRSEKNDALIQDSSIMESLLEILRSEDMQTNAEAFLYCLGTIKFLSGNPAFLHEMISRGAVEILISLIKQINDSTRESGTCLPTSGHLLVQATAALRHLVDSPAARGQLLSLGAFPQLCTVMEQRPGDQDVCTNVARIFSKLTSYHDCCVALADYPRCYASFLTLLNKHQQKQDLVVRVVFILGNLTAKHNQAREQFSREKGSLPTLLALLHAFSQPRLRPSGLGGRGDEVAQARGQAEDVLVKLVRVLANLAIHPAIGAAMAANPRVVSPLLSTLEHESIDDCQELVINTTAALNNLSYYQVKDSVIEDNKFYVAELLLKLLMSNNMDGILEAVRVFGNLSQDHDICDFIVQKKVHKFLLALLDARHRDLCFSACGVLLNLTVEKDRRALLKEGGSVGKLVACLRDLGPTDWQLASLVCKTLWNLSENVTTVSACFGDEDANSLLLLLSTFLDEDVALDGTFDQELQTYHKLHWEAEFKPVAQRLLHRIQTLHTYLEPLPAPF